MPELFIIQEDLSVKVQVCLCPPQCQSLQRELVWQQAPTSGVCKAPCSPSNANRNTHRRAGCSSLWNMSRQSDASWLQGFHDSWLGGPGNQMQQTLLPPILYANDVRLLALPSAESCWFVVTHFIVSIWASFLFFPPLPSSYTVEPGGLSKFL